jgi:hypothetical protein
VSEANEPTPPAPGRQSRLRVVFTLLVVISLGALLAWWLQLVPQPPVQKGPAAPRPAPAAAAPSSEPAPATPATASERPARRDRPRAGTTPRRGGSARDRPAAGSQRRRGAFAGPEVVGKTPLDTGEITPGHHQLRSRRKATTACRGHRNRRNPPPGEVSLKTVRLNTSVTSCTSTAWVVREAVRGRPTSIRDQYRDGFTLAFADGNLSRSTTCRGAAEEAPVARGASRPEPPTPIRCWC